MAKEFTLVEESPIRFRLQKLAELKRLLDQMEPEIIRALSLDLQKPELETIASEILPLRHEIQLFQKNLSRWARPQKVHSKFWTLTHLGARSWIRPESVGSVLIIGPWNYPFHLSLMPLIGAFAAGNRVTLKPSEFAPATSRLMADLVRKWSVDDWVKVREGGVETAQDLCKQSWGKIFFTGGTQVGRLVMAEAAKTLSPVTLELGGKSPAIFDTNVDLKTAARRLLWGKIYNAGQTCVAPDYVLVPREAHSAFAQICQETLNDFFPDGALNSPDYGGIVSQKHFERMLALMASSKILIGGKFDSERLRLEPTLLTEVNLESPLMTEEIFGPLLPVISYDSVPEALEIIASRTPPLAFYIFSRSQSFQETFVKRVRAGGVCINDTIVHLSNSRLPFGGFRESGIGAYHGEESFRCFSHLKPIEKKKFGPDIGLRYPPYKIRLNKFLRKFV